MDFYKKPTQAFVNILRSDRRFLEIFVISLVLGILYLPVFRDLIHAWDIKPQSSHGYLIMPIFFYLVWTKRRDIVGYQPHGNVAGLILVFLGMAFYIIGTIAMISTLSNLSMIINILGMLICLGGMNITCTLVFPVFFLIFMFPIPDAIYVTLTAPLKLFVSHLSVKILHLCGIAVIGEGNVIHLANMSLEVVEACSGMRSFVIYLMLGVLLAYFLPRKYIARKVILIGLAFPIAIVINMLRIVITSILSNRYGAYAAEGFFHEASGILLFMVGFFALAGSYYFLRERNSTDETSSR